MGIAAQTLRRSDARPHFDPNAGESTFLGASHQNRTRPMLPLSI